MLFPEPVFGPIHSRRLGTSLGINLLPANAKVCSFECIYCECGFATTHGEARIPERQEIATKLEAKLRDLTEKKLPLDVITFAGNGEPTLHPYFADIINDTITLRNHYFPDAKVTVLSNATRAYKTDVRAALLKIDNNVLKLDSAIQATAELINQPNSPDFDIEKIIDEIAFFDNAIVQTLFFSGDYNGHHIDNTTDVEITAWLAALRRINPREVMVYSLDRATPAHDLHKASPDTLTRIAERAKKAGFNVQLTL
ncbi:MAG: radical SAM protein [Paludibacteraceae bacterium]